MRVVGHRHSARGKIGEPAHRAADDARRRRHGAGQPDDPVAHRLGRDDDPGGRQPSHRLGRQAAAADPHAGDRGPLRLSRRGPHQARRGGRVHAHRDAAARRRRRRQRHAARQGGGARRVRQSGERAGRRFPARPGVQDDGRGRLAALPRGAVERRGDHRRGRGDAALRGQGHRTPARTPISR